jgi:hypothetical protein
MAKEYHERVLKKLQEKYGAIKNIGDGYSLYYVSAADFLVYFRYSKISEVGKTTKKTFYGLRKEEIALMRGKKSYICFLTDSDEKNIVIPFQQFEHYFIDATPSTDGQYKAFTIFKSTGTDLYFNNIGKFNVDNYLGIDMLFNLEKSSLLLPELTHTQIQSLIGSIGIKKGFDIWFPQNDKARIDNSIIDNSKIREFLPNYNKTIDHIISKIDVIWLNNTSPVSFYEVEHSTPIYSGLLRFNDVLLAIPGVENFNIIADNDRENKFSREVNRPTFRQNRLIDKVTFLDYMSIYQWYYNLYGKAYTPEFQ